MLAGMGGALAQNEADFVAAFSGDWLVHDPAYAPNCTKCGLSLQGATEGNRHPLAAQGCSSFLAGAVAWSILEGQLLLLRAGGDTLATLGGNQRRMSGATSDGAYLIIEREGGDGAAGALQAAIGASGCFQGNSCRPSWRAMRRRWRCWPT